MKIEHLKSFIAVYEEGTFTAAALRLYTVQPAITRQIALLEEELGTPLFTRTTRKVTPTPEGEVFYQVAKEAVDRIDEGIRTIRSLKSSNDAKLKIGYSYLYMDSITTTWVNEFKVQIPDMSSVTISETDPEPLLHQIEEDVIDGAFTGIITLEDIPSSLDYLVVAELGEKIVVGSNHHLANKQSVSIEDIANEVFAYPPRIPSVLLSPVRKELEEQNIPVNTIKADYEGSALKIVEMSGAIIDLPSAVPITNDTLIEIPYDSKYRIHYCFLWRKTNDNAGLQEFVTYLRRKLKDGPINEMDLRKDTESNW